MFGEREPHNRHRTMQNLFNRMPRSRHGGRHSIRRATAFMAMSRSWNVLANQVDRYDAILKEEGRRAPFAGSSDAPYDQLAPKPGQGSDVSYFPHTGVCFALLWPLSQISAAVECSCTVRRPSIQSQTLIQAGRLSSPVITGRRALVPRW